MSQKIAKHYCILFLTLTLISLIIMGNEGTISSISDSCQIFDIKDYMPLENNKIAVSWPVSSVHDDLDQYQEQDNGYEQIYGGLSFAQSFTPRHGTVTKVEIKIGCSYAFSWFFDILERIATVLPFLQTFVDSLKEYYLNSPGNLIISLYDSINNQPDTQIYSQEVSFDDISQNQTWYTFHLNKLEVVTNEEYFIVLQAYGGDKDTSYKWSYGSSNPYQNGKALKSTDDKATWRNLDTIDFCFRIYGEYTGEEPDGIVNRWGVLCGVDGDILTVGDDSAAKMYNILISHGWEPAHLKLLTNSDATKTGVMEAIKWMDMQEDGDDISLFYFCGHGAQQGIFIYPYPTGFLNAYELDDKIDDLGSKGIMMVFDSCYSGGLERYLKQNHRVILLSSEIDEESCGDIALSSGIFTYYLVMGLGSPAADINDDNWVSAEEVFYYAEPKTIKRAPYDQHPVLSDGFLGDLLITCL